MENLWLEEVSERGKGREREGVGRERWPSVRLSLSVGVARQASVG